jgi:hypothetical protein
MARERNLERADILDEYTDLIGRVFGPAVVPLFARCEHGMEVVATGILVRWLERCLLVTAWHALRDDRPLLLEPYGQRLPAPVVTTVDLKTLDLAIIALDEPRKALLENRGHRFLSEAALERSVVGPRAPDGRPYTFLGCPNSWNRSQSRNSRPELLAFTNREATLDVYEGCGLDPSVHVAVRFNHKLVAQARGLVTPPKLEGVSGGIVIGRWARGDDMPVRAVALFTDWPQGEKPLPSRGQLHVFGTRISCLFDREAEVRDGICGVVGGEL